MKPFDEDALLAAIHDALQETPIVRPRGPLTASGRVRSRALQAVGTRR
jgi:hypothetical protein